MNSDAAMDITDTVLETIMYPFTITLRFMPSQES